MTHYCFLLILICSCSASTSRNDIKADSYSPSIKTKVFTSEHGGFGYDIEIEGRLFVHQPNVPVIKSYKGFATALEAQHVADFVVMKIKNNQIPPALTAVEVDSLLKTVISK